MSQVSRPETSLTRRSLAATGLAGAAVALGAGTAQADRGHRGRGRDCIDDALLLPAPNPYAAQQAEMVRRLEYMVGCWSGPGWILTPDGRVDFTQTERVRLTLSGELMVIDGRGSVPRRPRELIFSAFATVRYNVENASYQWRAASQGGEMLTTLIPTDDGWYWDSEGTPGAPTRYQAWFDGRTWYETGVVTTPDGPQTIMEFTVRRR